VYMACGTQDSQLLISTVHEAVDHTFSQWQTLSIEDVELAITLLYQLAEALPVCNLCLFVCLSVCLSVPSTVHWTCITT